MCTIVNKLLTFFLYCFINYWYHIREDEYWVDTLKDFKAVLYNKNPLSLTEVKIYFFLGVVWSSYPLY